MLPEVCSFVNRVLRDLNDVTPDNREEKETGILRQALELASQRMESYHTKMRSHLAECKRDMDVIFKDHGVLTWIRDIEGETDPYRLSTICYDGRERELEEVRSKAIGNVPMAQVAHYIGRLGAHRYAVSMIITACIQVPVLRRIVRAVFLPSADARPVILPPEAANFYKTCKLICKNQCLPPHQGQSLNIHLCSRDIAEDYALSNKFEQLKDVLTRVHAELLIVDFFSRKKLKFVDNDRYVGCSKPACYFCHKWISLHPDGYETPAAHNQVILGCRGPDVDAGEDRMGNGARVRRSQYIRLAREIIRDINHQVGIRPGVGLPHHQSSNGSTRAPSTVSRL
ncbi:hypothetical protein ASPCAL01637 [Aspergillus calidoustus]|uniref:Uncharacterized protein n=1 Tax=Aspergillus calidoustus TaxID=454130 RepID=A0A0U5FUR0_ASPCI|nr:hypothetical protein ASPCAL01637 [Aspergillus calidoustus]